MKPLLWMLCLCGSVAAQTAEQVSNALAGRGEVDEIRWSDPARGPAFRVGIVRALPEGLEVQRGAAKRVLPYEQIGGVKFGWSMGERQLVAEARVDAIPALRVFWEARRLSIQLAGSQAGDFGLALARALRKAGAEEEARGIVREIADQDRDDRRRARAKAEAETLDFVEALRSGKPEEVEKRARAVTESADESNAELMLLATGCLLERDFAKLKQIESDNPRWMEDDEVKPERDRLYHRALDLALYPSVFHPRREGEAAEGLWRAAEIYRYTGESSRETGVLEDLQALYPQSTRSGEAKERLAALQAARRENSPPAAKSKEEPEQKPAESKSPPPPKRYNLFED